MVYLNFTKILPPTPNDPTVNELTQLNNNLDVLDAGLNPYINGGTISNIEQGQEFLSSSSFAVWDGSATRTPDDIMAAWSAWTNIPMFSPRAIRTGFQPKWRSNSLLRQVQLTGGIQADNVATAWPMGSLLQFNSLAAGSPSNSFAPIGGKHVSQCGAALTAGTSVAASGYIVIDVSGSFVRMSAQYLGGGGGGNFLQLEQVRWWY